MKKIFLAICGGFFFLLATAQVPSTRVLKPDTTKKNTRPTTSATTGVSSIPGLKTGARGTILNNNQIPVLGIDSNIVYFTEDARFPKLRSEIVSNSLAADYRYTPKQPYINEDNFVVFSSAETDISATNQRWEFKRNMYNTGNPYLKFLVRLQPAKDYLIIIEANVKSKNQPLTLAFHGVIGKYHNTTFFFPAATGKNEFTAILHMKPTYEYVKFGADCSCFGVKFQMSGDAASPEPAFQAEITSIRIKEIKL